jgi:phosphonate transport system permease protein
MTSMLNLIQNRKKLLLNLSIVLVFLWSLTTVNWSNDLIRPSGAVLVWEILKGIVQPNLSSDILTLAIQSTWLTVVYATCALTLAILFGFIFGVLASGALARGRLTRALTIGFFRSVLNFTRAIHELVWAWIFVASFGLSPYAGILAMAIPYAGILGRILADAINDVPEEPIQALRAAGANQWQCLIYGYLPYVWTEMISYTIYRYECAIRSSAIMSFVGLGGLGYQIQLSLADLRFDEVWTFLFFLILIVVLVDFWSSSLRKSIHQTPKTKPLHRWFSLKRLSILIVFGLMYAAWHYVTVVQEASFLKLFTSENLAHAKKFFSSLLGLDEEVPAFFVLENWKSALLLSWETMTMSLIAIGITVIVMFLTVIPGARNFADGTFTVGRKWYQWPFFMIVRVFYIITRAVPELIWAMMIVFVLQPGILAGALALAIHNFGILGKLCAEVVEEIDARPVQNLRLSGANKLQMLLYGIVPTVMPRFLSFIFYRWEVIMRTTIVVGFIGAGGLGQEFKLNMSFFDYSHVSLLLVCYLALVFIADGFSEFYRKNAK